MVAFEIAKQNAEVARKASKSTGEALNAFPKGAMGITPDAVRATPEWKEAKAAFDRCFAAERAANSFLTKNFKRELLADRKARNAAGAL